MRIFFIRHGQTEFNKQGRVQGQGIDMPLNDTGIEQVERAISQLPQNIDFIISSPLKRAFQTAEIINKKINKTIEIRDDTKEFSYGSLAGKTWPEIEAETGDSKVHQKDIDLLFDYRPYGGESAEDLKLRVKKFVDDVKNKYSDKRILVAAHSGVMDAMHILFPQKEKKETANATLHEFEI